MGPHHPATHGVLRLLVSLEGEIVRDLKPIVGYVHTGIEKNCEDKSYWKVIPSLSAWTTSPTSSTWRRSSAASSGCWSWRSAACELSPSAPHGAQPHPFTSRVAGDVGTRLGAMSMFFYCFRDRDRILDLFEMSTGQRMHTRYFQVGGCSRTSRSASPAT